MLHQNRFFALNVSFHIRFDEMRELSNSIIFSNIKMFCQFVNESEKGLRNANCQVRIIIMYTIKKGLAVSRRFHT